MTNHLAACAQLWKSGVDTAQMARKCGVPESMIYNHLSTIRATAAEIFIDTSTSNTAQARPDRSAFMKARWQDPAWRKARTLYNCPPHLRKFMRKLSAAGIRGADLQAPINAELARG